MSESTPIVYLLYGDDEFEIAQQVAQLADRLGDPVLKEANVTRLDGETLNLEDLFSESMVMPFLTKRRMVIVNQPLARFELPRERAREISQEKKDQITRDQNKFLKILENLPPTTALVLVENRDLESTYKKRSGESHWLVKWTNENADRALVKKYMQPRGGGMVNWVLKRVKSAGGEITPQAAKRLSDLVEGDSRLADQEICKLLDYVNYQRIVDLEDVERLTADVSEANIFAMVDAVGNKDGKTASKELRRLLDQREASFVFSMVVRQFRFLLLIKEISDSGRGKQDILNRLKFLRIKPFMVDRMMPQARKFTMRELESVYRRLLDLDSQIKSSKTSADLALVVLVSELSDQGEKDLISRSFRSRSD